MMRIWLVVLFVLLFAPPGLPLVFGEEPALPLGLGEDQKTQEEEPALPAGLGEDDSAASGASTAPMKETSLPFNYRGFLESRGGVRVFDDPNEKSASIGEVRLQTQVDKDFDWVSARITSDFLADTVANDWPVELETGDGFIDLREAFLFFRMGEYADLKVGRQILTWGTGDFLFINDLFPKDYNAFFIGRDDEYLKAPSDALKLSLFSEVVNLDFVYTPSFDADRFIDGRRISFFNPLAGDITGRDQPLQVDRPQGWFRDDEISARLYRRFGSV
ncbi:MAG: hypothetical protein KDD70_13620, partial [Bdellovibrionales bacterium]|nr:hypothetical protein [Bdellovibrionales bacterium]